MPATLPAASSAAAYRPLCDRWLGTALLVAACGAAERLRRSGPEPRSPSPTVAGQHDRRRAGSAARPPAEPVASATPAPTEGRPPLAASSSTTGRGTPRPGSTVRQRVMIGYGCTPAPYYDHDPRCPGRQGFHHGIDVAMPCGTPLFSAVAASVLDPSSSGAPGAAYGERPFRIRTGHRRRAHRPRPPGLRATRATGCAAGQRIALASDSGAPDGCHLHFEVRRPVAGSRRRRPGACCSCPRRHPDARADAGRATPIQ